MEKILRGAAVVGQSGGPTAAINATLAGVISGYFASNDNITKLYGMRNGIEGFIAERMCDLGDIFASALVGALMRGCGAYRASQIAADFALACIRKTAELPNHWYGAAFEPVLGKLIEMLQ